MVLIERNSVSTSFENKLIAGLIFLYWMLYENVFFFNANQGGLVFLIAVNGIKLFLPFMLLWLSGINAVLLSKGFTSLYGFIFIFFVLWVGLVTLSFGEGLEWIKLFPRLVFFYSVLNFVYKKPIMLDLYAKLVIVYVLFALVQYCLTYLTASTEVDIQILGVQTAGLGGLYSNITSAMSFPGISGRVLRLVGFWNEPSNAAGTAFASGFLGLYLRARGYNIRKGVPAICFFAGVLGLSNAGYFGFALGLIVYIFYTKKRGGIVSGKLTKLLILIVPLFILMSAVLGRMYVQKNEIESNFIRAIFGARDDDDPFSGRTTLFSRVLDYIAENPLGRGLYVPDFKTGDVMLSAQAPIYWLYTGGIIGIVLLGLRELILVKAAIAVIKVDQPTIYLFSALAAVMGQQLVYGSWMNPNYLILAAAILAFNARSKLIN